MNAATAPRPMSPAPKAFDQKLAEQRSHEPSMEEILASIRRIIADDSALPLAPRPVTVPVPAIPPPLAVLPPSVEEAKYAPTAQWAETAAFFPIASAAPPAEENLSAPGLVAPNFVMSPTPPVEAPPLLPAPAPLTHVAMETPSADMAAIAAALHFETGESVSHQILHDEDILDLADPTASDFAVPDAQEADSWHINPHIAPVAEIRMPEVQVADAKPAEALAHAALPLPQRQQEAPQPHYEALTSPNTDAAVSSSFQALATSLFLNNAEMVEKLTREMLRPMLKNWLDDNLPVMVERLVRAEIERVARGGR